jgi:hypothetical protein
MVYLLRALLDGVEEVNRQPKAVCRKIQEMVETSLRTFPRLYS